MYDYSDIPDNFDWERDMDQPSDELKRSQHSIRRYISVLDQVAETEPDMLVANEVLLSADWIMIATYGTERSNGFMYYN